MASPRARGARAARSAPTGRRTCTVAFYERCLRLLPDVMADPGCRALLRRAMWSTRRDERDPEAVLAGVVRLAALAGSTDRHAGSELLRRFVERMGAAGLPCVVSGYSKARGLVRTLKVGWDAEWLAAIEADLRAPVSEGERVVFVSGARWSRRKELVELRKVRAELQHELAGTSCPPSTRAKAEYLNDRPSNAFAELGHRAEAMLPQAARIADPVKRAHVERVLGALAEQPVPAWRPCENSARVRPVGTTAAQLPRELRAELFRDYLVEFDLASAQLAVVARLWNVPKIQQLLEGGGSFWGVVLGDLGLPASAKESIKPATYAVCYGAGCKKILEILVGGLTKLLGAERAEEAARGFLRHPLVRCLLRARKVQLEKIKAEGGGVDCEGMTLRVTRKRRPHDVLAALAQSVEQALTWPAYLLAQQHPADLAIVFDLGDGFAVRFFRDAERWGKKLVEVVGKRAAELGVPTHLEPKLVAKAQPPAEAPAPSLPAPAQPAPAAPQDVAVTAPGPRPMHPVAERMLAEHRAREAARRVQEAAAAEREAAERVEVAPLAAPPVALVGPLDVAARLAVAREALAERVARMRLGTGRATGTRQAAWPHQSSLQGERWTESY